MPGRVIFSRYDAGCNSKNEKEENRILALLLLLLFHRYFDFYVFNKN